MSHPPAPDTTTIGSAPTRLCLGGEDLDWIGGPALLAAIELRVEMTYERQETSRTLTLRSEGALRARLSLPQPDWSAPTNSDLELIRLGWQHAARPIAGGRITIHSAAPASAGLASSAAACVAALRAFLPRSTQQEMNTDELIGAAYHLERNVAGRPVGPMDFVPAVLGGTTLISSASETITELTHLPLPAEARFVVVDTRTPRDTGAVIAWKRARLAAGERGLRLYADRMPDLVEHQARLLQAGGDLEALGQTLDEAQALLCHQMKVSTPLIDTCAARLRGSGALGVKLTGTGLGGCLFALTTAAADTDRLTHSLRDLPVSTRLIRPADTIATTEAVHDRTHSGAADSRRRPLKSRSDSPRRRDTEGGAVTGHGTSSTRASWDPAGNDTTVAHAARVDERTTAKAPHDGFAGWSTARSRTDE